MQVCVLPHVSVHAAQHCTCPAAATAIAVVIVVGVGANEVGAGGKLVQLQALVLNLCHHSTRQKRHAIAVAQTLAVRGALTAESLRVCGISAAALALISDGIFC
jgi:hypothetical protein